MWHYPRASMKEPESLLLWLRGRRRTKQRENLHKHFETSREVTRYDSNLAVLEGEKAESGENERRKKHNNAVQLYENKALLNTAVVLIYVRCSFC